MFAGCSDANDEPEKDEEENVEPELPYTVITLDDAQAAGYYWIVTADEDAMTAPIYSCDEIIVDLSKESESEIILDGSAIMEGAKANDSYLPVRDPEKPIMGMGSHAGERRPGDIGLFWCFCPHKYTCANIEARMNEPAVLKIKRFGDNLGIFS